MDSIHYDNDYLFKNPGWHYEHSPWKAQKIINIIKNNDIFQLKKIAEIGCGAGGILEYLYKNYNPEILYTGYDISDEAIEIAKKKSGQYINYKKGDIQSITEKYDMLICADVFEHIPDYFGFLDKLKQHSHYFVFHIPLDISVLSLMRLFPIINQRKQVGHLHHFFKDSALDGLKLSGYTILDWKYTNHGIEIYNTTFKEKTLNLIRNVLQKFNEDFTVRMLGGYSMVVLCNNFKID